MKLDALTLPRRSTRFTHCKLQEKHPNTEERSIRGVKHPRTRKNSNHVNNHTHRTLCVGRKRHHSPPLLPPHKKKTPLSPPHPTHPLQHRMSVTVCDLKCRARARLSHVVVATIPRAPMSGGQARQLESNAHGAVNDASGMDGSVAAPSAVEGQVV